MKKTYFVIYFILVAIIPAQADNLKNTVKTYCVNNPELYQQVVHIIDNETQTPEQKLTQLSILQQNASADLEGKILECVDIYTEIALELQDHANGFMTIDQLKDEPEMSLNQGADVFKMRLLNALKKLDTTAKIALMYALCTGDKQPSDPNQSSFFDGITSTLNKKTTLIGVICAGLITTYSYLYNKLTNVKNKALDQTPLSEWISSSEIDNSTSRSSLLHKIAVQFPSYDAFPSAYESLCDNTIVPTSSVETFLNAAKKEEKILHTYITWESWAEKLCVAWLLPFSKQESSIIKNKLQQILTMQEII
jgi:hypothetical protein